MTLVEQLMATLPELNKDDFNPVKGTISIQDDSDGLGAYIAKWEYSQPIPDGLKLGK